MGEEINNEGLIGVRQEEIPTRHKIDFWGAFILVLGTFPPFVMSESITNFYLTLYVPNDMLVHGPVIQNLSQPDLRIKPLMCNPYFSLLQNQYMTDEMRTYKKLKSYDFLAEPGVKQFLNDTNTIHKRNWSAFSMGGTKLCEVIPPANDRGSCMTFSEIKAQCLDGYCGTPNACFWEKAPRLQMLAFAQVLVYFVAMLMSLGLMHDPAPAKMQKFLHPVACGVAYALSATFAFVGAFFCVYAVESYTTELLLETYPKFYVTYQVGYLLLVVTPILSIIFSIPYFYVGKFGPKYPRLKNRWELRRKYFQKRLESIKSDMQYQA